MLSRLSHGGTYQNLAQKPEPEKGGAQAFGGIKKSATGDLLHEVRRFLGFLPKPPIWRSDSCEDSKDYPRKCPRIIFDNLRNLRLRPSLVRLPRQRHLFIHLRSSGPWRLGNSPLILIAWTWNVHIMWSADNFRPRASVRPTGLDGWSLIRSAINTDGTRACAMVQTGTRAQGPSKP